MDHRGDDNSDNSSDITQLTDSVELNHDEPAPTTINPDPSIVLDTNPAPVTQHSTTTSAQTTRKRTKATTNTSDHTTVATTTASGSSHPRTRRSARISELASPDADQSTSSSGQASTSSTGGAVGKGKKRAQAEETEAAGPSKKQSVVPSARIGRRYCQRTNLHFPSLSL